MLKSLLLALYAVPLVAASACKHCNADNCLRAVRASHHYPYPSSATADCSSFFSKTVTPCVVTSTTSTTVTATATPVTVTNTIISDTTIPITSVDSITSVESTIQFTATVVQSSEVVVTSVSYSTIIQSIAPARKRNVVPELLPVPVPAVAAQGKIRGRSVTLPTTSTSIATCAAATGTPSSVPSYASACSGTKRYSSACSCAGIKAKTTTLKASTTVITQTSTTTVTPTATATAIDIVSVTVTTVVTQIQPSTFSTTDATVVLTSLYTSVEGVVVPTTISVQYCNVYKFLASDGSFQGEYLSGTEPNPNQVNYGNPMFNSGTNLADGIAYTLRQDGTVYADNTYALAAKSNYDYVYQLTDYSLNAYTELSRLYCSIDAGGSTDLGASGTLTCTLNGNAQIFQTCSAEQTSGRTNWLLHATTVVGGCTEVDLAAIFVGTRPC